MSGRRWTPDEMAAFRRLASGEAADVADLVRRFGAFTGRDLTRASADSLLRRIGISARDVIEAHARNVGHSTQVPTVRNTHESQPQVDIPAEPEPPAQIGSAAPGADSLVALLFDLHLPEHDRPAWSAVLRWLQDHRPDEVILSEFAEWESASQHSGNWGTRWDRDVANVKRGLVQLRSVLPASRIVWQETNHDTRLTRILEERLPAFAGSLTIPRELDLEKLGIEWVNERTVIRRGALKVIHGHQLATNDRSGLLPKYHAARAVQLYGEPGCTVVYGHTHKTQSWSEPCDGGEKRAVNVGCLRTLRPAWQRGREAGWLHQFAAAYVSAAGPASLYLVDIHGGAFTFAGKRYAA